MSTLTKCLTIVIFIIFASACSKENSDVILGDWKSDYATARIGSDEELSQYNNLEFSKKDVKLRNYINKIQDHSTIEVFDSSEKQVKYELKEKNHIMIDDTLYKITLNHNEMILQNDNVQMHYFKD